MDALPSKAPLMRRVQALTAEFVGTFLLVMTISLSAQAGNPPSYPTQHLAIGLTLGSMIYALDHISGAHFNPAVTLGALLNQKIDILSAFFYVIVQVAGGVTGALTALAIASSGNIKPFNPQGTAPWGATGSAFAVEFLFTLALCLVMQNAALEKNGREPNSYFGLAVSFTVLAGARAVGPISGGCFNPAVGTALDIASMLTPGGPSFGNIASIWIYWVAPCLGAVAASLLKMYMNLPSHAEAEGLPLVVPATEAVGTFFVVLTAALTGDGMAVGAMVLAMVYMGDHVCGADYNPAITLGVALRMAIPLAETWKVAVTMAAQFGGAMLAAFIAYQVSGTVTYPAADGVKGVAGAAVFEALWTGLLVYVVCAVMTPTTSGEGGGDDGAAGPGGDMERKGHSRSFQGLAIGFVVTGGIYCATATGGGSGGVFNPALGSAIVTMDWAYDGRSPAQLWVYFVGPFGGSLLGAGLFKLLHWGRDPLVALTVDGSAGLQGGDGYADLEPSYYM